MIKNKQLNILLLSAIVLATLFSFTKVSNADRCNFEWKMAKYDSEQGASVDINGVSAKDAETDFYKNNPDCKDKGTGTVFRFSFGGRVVSKQMCTCNNDAYIVTVQGSGSSSGTYLETSSARGYKYYFLNAGRFVLGNYTPGGQCLMAGNPCYPQPITKGTITMFGASF